MIHRWPIALLLIGLVALFAPWSQAAAATAVIETNHADWYNPSSFGNHPITEGYAPYPVFFEGWKSTPRDDIKTWRWNFGDGSPVFDGFNAAHVFENPGTYTVTLTVTTKTGQTASTTTSVTALARDGNTYYVDSAIGNDSNNGLSPSTPWKTGNKALFGMTNNFYGPGDQILFKRGQTFDIEGGLCVINHYKSGWGYMFGTYGEGPKPILQNVGASANPLITQYGKNAAHITFMDLEFRMALTSDLTQRIGNMWEMREQSQNLLIYRCDIVHPGMFISLSGGHNVAILSSIFLIEDTVQDSAFIDVWGKATRFAMIGCHLDWANNHIFYGSYFNSAIFANNIFTRPAFGRTALRLAAAVDDFSYPTQNVHVINNYFGGHIDPVVDASEPAHDGGFRYNYEMIYLAPNASLMQSMKDVIYEKNIITNCEAAIIVGCYENLIIRDNLISTVDTYGEPFRLILGHKFERRPLVNIQVYDNTFWSNQKRSGNSGMVQFVPYRSAEWNGLTEHQNLSVTNNTFYMQGAVDPIYYLDSDDPAQVTGLNAQITTDYNTIHAGDGSKFGYVGGHWNSGGTIYSLDDWRTTFGQDAHSTIAAADLRPFPGQVYSPPFSYSNTIAMTYDGVGDIGGTGIAEVQLWVKQGTSAWANTGQKATGLTGTFTYTAPGVGTYYFATVTKDNSNRVSILPTDYPNAQASTKTIVYGTGPPPPPTPDTTAPTPGSATSPAQALSSSVTVSYSGASDNAGGSGLKTVYLWVKKDSGAWSNSGMSAATASGSFNYTLPGYGTYQFKLQADDNASPSNVSPAPSGAGDSTTVFEPIVAGLIANLKFDDPSDDGVATDSSTGGNAGSMSGTTTPAYSASGKTGGAYDFDGADRVSLGTMDIAGTGLTLAAWVKADTFGAYRKVICKSDGVTQANTYWAISMNADGSRPRVQLKTADGVTDSLEAPSGISLNQWAHLAATYDQTTLRLYINGAEVASMAKSGALATNGALQAWIGDVPPSGSRGWDGMIDEVRIYNYALPAGEVQTLGGGGGAPTDTTAPVAGTASVSPYGTAWPATISYSGAGDASSGLKNVVLWSRKGAGAWASTGLISTTASGSFSYSGSSDDTYMFALVAEDNAGNKSSAPSGSSGFATHVHDATPATNGAITVGAYSSTPVSVTFSGASDTTSGIGTVELWAKKGSGSWAATGLTSTLASGTFSWGGTTGDSTYYFGLRVVDKAGNATPSPSGSGQASTILDSAAPSVGTLSAASGNASASPISLSYANVSDAGSGLKKVSLWFKKNAGGAWTDSGLSQTTGSGSFAFTGMSGDATYFFALRVEDNAGNKTAAPAGSGSASVLYDTQAPSAGTVSLSGQFVNSAPFSVTFSGVSDAGSGIKEVRLWSKKGSGAWSDTGLTHTSASGSFSYSPGSGDGVYSFALRVEDNVGNKSSAPSGSGQASTTYDVTAPTVGSLTGPSSANQAPATLSYTGGADATSGLKNIHLWVRKPGSGWTDTGMVSTLASGSFSYNDFSTAGTYNFAVQAEDKASNSSASPSGSGQLALTFDSAAPDAPTAVSAPANTKISPIPVSYSGAGDSASGLKQVILWVKKGTGGSWAATAVTNAAASGTLNYSGMSGDATYFFAVQSEDNAGNKSANPSGSGQANSVYDATAPPDATATAPQYASSVPITVTYTGASDVTEGRLWFKKDGGAWTDSGLTQASNSGTFNFNGVAGDGVFSWAVQTKDGAGNQSATPSGAGSASTTFDTAAPTAPAVTAAATAKASPVTVSYTNATDAASGVKEVGLWFKKGAAGAWTDSGLLNTTATGSFSFSGFTGDDSYVLTTRVKDNAGNLSTTSTSPTTTITFDTTAPNPGIASAPASASAAPLQVSYAGASDSGSGLATVGLWVKVDAGAWSDTGLSATAASGSFSYTPAGDGSLAFALRATDNAGNSSGTPAGAGDATTTFDSTPPSGAAVSTPSFANAGPVTVSYTASGDVATAHLWTKKGSGGAWTDTAQTQSGASGSFSFNAFSGDDTYFFAVQTEDSANNLSDAPTGAGASSTVFDTATPTGGSITAPANHGTGGLSVTYAGVTDSGSGLKLVHLYVQKDGGAWTDTGMIQTGSSGTYAFSPSQGDGTYAFALRAEDKAGNIAAVPSGAGLASTTVDTAAPTGGAITAPEQASQGPLVLAYGGLTDTASGIKSVELWVRKGPGSWAASGLTSTLAEGTFSFNGLTGDGTYYFALVGIDNANNRMGDPTGNGLASTVFDGTAPSGAALTSPAYASGSPIAVSFSGASDNGSGLKTVKLWARKGSGGWADTGLTKTTASGTFSYSGVSGDATYYFFVQTEDNAGNLSPAPAGDGSTSTVVDTAAPTLGTLTAASQYDTSSPIDLVFSGISDGGSGLDVVTLWAKQGSGAWAATPMTSGSGAGQFAYAVAGGEGSYQFALVATDKAGNSTATPSGAGLATVTFDTTAPTTGTMTAPSHASTSPISISYSGVTESGSGLAEARLYVRKDSGAWTEASPAQTATTASGSFSYPISTGDGTYHFAIRTKDKAGNESPAPSGSGAASTQYDSTAPTAGSITAPQFAKASPVTLSYTGANDDGSGLLNVHLWVKKDTGAWADTGQVSTTSSGTFSYSGFTGDGAYYFALRAENNAHLFSAQPSGNGSASMLYDTTAPTAGSLQGPYSDDNPPINLVYSGVSDGTGSGIAKVHLWARKGAGAWADSGQIAIGASGSFAYSGMSGNDSYHFALRSEDYAGNLSAAPTGNGQFTVVYDTTFSAGVATSPAFATQTPIVVGYSGAQAPEVGTVTVHLWVRKGAEGTWQDSGMETQGASGQIQYVAMTGDDTYYFAIQAESQSGNLTSEPFGDGDTHTVYDTVPPEAQVLTSPPYAKEAPITIEYAAVEDAGSGVKQVLIWVKKGVSGIWEDTGLTQSGTEGSFQYNDLPEDDTYYFYLQVEDNAGLKSPVPTDELVFGTP